MGVFFIKIQNLKDNEGEKLLTQILGVFWMLREVDFATTF